MSSPSQFSTLESLVSLFPVSSFNPELQKPVCLGLGEMATGQSHLLTRNFCPYHLRLISTTPSLLPPLPSFSSSSSYSLKPRFTLSSSEKLTRASTFRATSFDDHGGTSKMADIDWDNLRFNPMPTDYMYVMRCATGEKFLDGGLQPFGEIELNPFSSVLNYGQGIIEGLKAVRKEDGSILLFRPEENGLRIRMGADRMCMPAPTIEQFVQAVKVTVLANRRWVPPPKKGFLHIRPLLMGSGPVLSLTPSPEFIFLIYVTPVGNYFEGRVQSINLVVENETHRAVPGAVGSVKAIGNYASIMTVQAAAKVKGFDDVLYLDAVHNRYVEEVSTANIFIVKDKMISTPGLIGTILPGITRQSVIDVARSQGFKVEERPVAVEELFGAEEVFCTGNAVGLLPVGSITYMDKRVCYKGGGVGTVSHHLSSVLTSIQMGLTEDKMGWTVSLR